MKPVYRTGMAPVLWDGPTTAELRRAHLHVEHLLAEAQDELGRADEDTDALYAELVKTGAFDAGLGTRHARGMAHLPERRAPGPCRVERPCAVRPVTGIGRGVGTRAAHPRCAAGRAA